MFPNLHCAVVAFISGVQGAENGVGVDIHHRNFRAPDDSHEPRDAAVHDEVSADRSPDVGGTLRFGTRALRRALVEPPRSKLPRRVRRVLHVNPG